MEQTYEVKQYQRWGIATETQACANCKHFQQHYCKDGTLIYSGHCCYPRMKPRKVWDTCKFFEKEDR